MRTAFTEGSIRFIEAAPCAAYTFYQQHGSERRKKPKSRTYDVAAADIALDFALSSLMVGRADEVLIPLALVQHMELEDLACPSPSSLFPLSFKERWKVLKSVKKGSLSVLVPHLRDLKGFLTLNRQCAVDGGAAFSKVYLPVPWSPISSQILFPEYGSIAHFYQTVVPQIQQLLCEDARRSTSGGVGGESVSWVAWMRSALSCRWEGSFSSPIRLGDCTAALLASGSCEPHWVETYRPDQRACGKEEMAAQSGCEGVIWEEGIENALTPRWLETILKTSSACGVPLSRVGLSLCNGSAAPMCWMKAVDASLSQFVTCSVPAPIFSSTDQRVSLLTLFRLVQGRNNCAEIQKAVEEDGSANHAQKIAEEVLQQCAAWSSAAGETWERFAKQIDASRRRDAAI